MRLAVKRCSACLVVLVISVAWCRSLAAAPMISIRIEARPSGSAQPFSPNIQAIGGATYDFQVVALMAPIGTTNSTGVGSTIKSLTYNSHASTGDGIANLKFDLFQSASDPVQVSLTSPASLNTSPVAPSVAGDNVSWSSGTGASGGIVTPRAGGSGNDLLAIRPVHVAGVQTAVTLETVLTGQFVVPLTTPSGSSLVQGRWTSGGTGVFKLNGGAALPISSATEAGADPYVSFTPLTISVPEPTGLGLIFACGLALLCKRPAKAR